MNLLIKFVKFLIIIFLLVKFGVRANGAVFFLKFQTNLLISYEIVVQLLGFISMRYASEVISENR